MSIKRSFKPIKRSSRPRRQRRGTIAALKRKLDALVGAEVRSRGWCEFHPTEVAGPDKLQGDCNGPLQWAHGFSRRYLGTRWDLGNGFCLCAKAHLRMTHRPAEWEAWMQNRLGMTMYLALQAKALAITRFTRAELEARLAELSAKGGL